MYSLFRLLPLREILLKQAPTLGTALIIAELFYKFHSFILESTAFLATWFVLDFAVHLAMKVFRGRVKADLSVN